MLDAHEITKVIAYCKSMAPIEAGGYINTDGFFVSCRNVHPKPTEEFEFADVPHDARAVIHSHPQGPFCPSEKDQHQQIAWGVPWAIVAFDDKRTELFWFGDEAPKPPLLGRGFRHYVTDCYAALRDLYLYEAGIILPDFPRRWEWWDTDASMFNDGFESAGFVQVAYNDVRPGDVLLMAIPRGEKPNHCATWLGDGLIYHHMSSRTESEPRRLATVEYAGRYFDYVRKVLRYDNNRITRTFGEKVRSVVSL